MLLGNRHITAGDTRRYLIDYREFLQPGDTVSAVTVTTTSTHSSVGVIQRDVMDTRVFFFILAGAAGEVFTVAVQITTVFGEIVNDTIDFQTVPA